MGYILNLNVERIHACSYSVSTKEGLQTKMYRRLMILCDVATMFKLIIIHQYKCILIVINNINGTVCNYYACIKICG